MSNSISDKDKKDWENFLTKNESLPNKDLATSKIKASSPRICDLHGYSLNQANKKINDLIHDSYETGVSKLIIVTGKGLHSENEKDPYISKEFGILKYSVPEYIKKNQELMSLISEIKDASIDHGGSGAFYIYLKKKIIK